MREQEENDNIDSHTRHRHQISGLFGQDSHINYQIDYNSQEYDTSYNPEINRNRNEYYQALIIRFSYSFN